MPGQFAKTSNLLQIKEHILFHLKLHLCLRNKLAPVINHDILTKVLIKLLLVETITHIY